jgi:V/A-type H+/Na+-transporting ATPase subunit F
MTELAVIGNNEFVMGFELIGLSKVFEAETAEKIKYSFTKAMGDQNIGIIVTNDAAIEKLEGNFRRQVESSITPVVVVLSSKGGAQENLREMIKKAIGIDLWNK